jgi:hypothetical protein
VPLTAASVRVHLWEDKHMTQDEIKNYIAAYAEEVWNKASVQR